MNSKATADALATRFAGLTVTLNGVSEALATEPTASLPNRITKGPVILIFHPIGVLDVVMSRIRTDELDFPVRLLRDPLNVPDRADALYAWYDVMRDQVEKNLDLDLAYVAWARPITMRAAIDGHLYAGDSYDLVELIVRVHYNEIVTTIAA